MYQEVYTKQCKKDIKLIKKQGKDRNKLKQVIELLAYGKPLPEKYKDHWLTGNWAGCRECHIQPDWLLIYKIHGNFLYLLRTGSHSNLFNEALILSISELNKILNECLTE